MPDFTGGKTRIAENGNKTGQGNYTIISLIDHYSSYGEMIKTNSAEAVVRNTPLLHKDPPQISPLRTVRLSYATVEAEKSIPEKITYRDRTIGVVVPAYNEALLIGETLSSIPAFVSKIYVVDDCSKDTTWALIKEYAKSDPRIVPIHHEQNKGVGASIITGYKKALEDGIDIAAVMAGDNQMDPSFLPNLLDPIVDGKCDYTMGNRLISPEYRKGMSNWRFFGNSVLTLLTKMASGCWQMMDPQNGYTAISRRALERINLDDVYPRYGYCNDLLVKLNVWGFRVVNVPHPARYGREKSGIKYSTYILRVSRLLLKDFFWRLKMKYVMLSFHPLVFYYIFGWFLTILGVFGGIYSLYLKFVQEQPIFVPATLSLLVFSIGAQLCLFAMLFDMEQEKSGSGWY
jgi:glycosyltransferase involved in cell wall biosynthesis